MGASALKTLRIRLKTGETILKKDVEEFLIGKLYFVSISESSGPQLFPADNVLVAELYKNGAYNKVFPLRRERWTKA